MKKCRRCCHTYPNEAFKSTGVASKGKLQDNCDMCREEMRSKDGKIRLGRKIGAPRECDMRKLTVEQFKEITVDDDLKKHFQITTHRLTEPLI